MKAIAYRHFREFVLFLITWHIMTFQIHTRNCLANTWMNVSVDENLNFKKIFINNWITTYEPCDIWFRMHLVVQTFSIVANVEVPMWLVTTESFENCLSAESKKYIDFLCECTNLPLTSFKIVFCSHSGEGYSLAYYITR